MILITFIRDIFRLLLNIQTQDSKPQDESYLSLLATDIILITSLFIFTFFAILTTTQETFNTHMKFQNQRKNLPEDIKKTRVSKCHVLLFQRNQRRRPLGRICINFPHFRAKNRQKNGKKKA